MPRTSLAWRLFAGWCALVALVLLACLWLASVQLAALATEGQRRRLLDAATALAAVVDPARPDARDALPARAAEIRAATGVDLEVFTGDGTPLAAAGPPDGDAAALVERARAGRPVAGSRYDLASGRRFLALAVPFGPAGAPRAIVRASADTAAADRELARSQTRLLAGCLASAVAAVATGYALARRCARPVADLCAAATRLAAGDVGTPIPVAEPDELGGLSAALEQLRDQLVERGLTIGRQGTQQEAVLASMIEGVLAIDARQRVVAINREAADLLGIDLARTAGRTLQEVVRNPDIRRFALTAIDCLEPVEDELVLRGQGARDLTIQLRGTALRDPSGEGGAVIVLNDVTDRQRLERVRRDFVANVSHELKTPVASIKGFVETLLDGALDDPADARRFLEIVGRQADRLAAIIEDLLALSRVEQSEDAGTLPLETVPIAAVLAAAAGDCAPRAADRAIVLQTDCPAGLAAEVNSPLLEQALINLVDNAIKHSDPGRAVRLAAAAAGDEVVIAVRDEGCGIAAEHLPRLFERFYRVDKARSRRLGGTGLGLSIVKHIAQAHGGTVAVESTPGAGSTFTIRLPRRRPTGA